MSDLLSVEQVGGVTHTSKDEKTEISFMMQVDEAATGLKLDVSLLDSFVADQWWYNQYLIDITMPPPMPTGTPTVSPPTTDVPTGVPTTSATHTASWAAAMVVALAGWAYLL